jgi:RimJ/RimL family protein N-acetyltransferase
VIPLETNRLIIRNWDERDRDLFFEINSDERVMEHYPYRRTRQEADAVFDEWTAEINATPFGKFPVELKQTGECMGYCGLVPANVPPTLATDAIEIGWRFASRFWGKGYASEAARALLRYGFEDLGLKEIISFTIPVNLRSQAVMRRIGMRRDEAADFDLPRIPDNKPEFKRHVLYRLTKADWAHSSHRHFGAA